jgi:hypothetical protein
MKTITIKGKFWEIFLLTVLTCLTLLQLVYFGLLYEMSTQFNFTW